MRRLPSHHLHTNLVQPNKITSSANAWTTSTKNCTGNTKILPMPRRAAWRPDIEAGVQMFLSVPRIASKEQNPGELRNLTLTLIADRFPNNVWTPVYTDWSAENGTKNGGNGVYNRYPGGDITSLSVPGGFQCSNNRAEILVICTAAEHLLESGKQMGNITIFTDFLSSLQALNSTDPDQMIQGLHSSLAKLTAQFPVSLRWVPAQMGLTGNERADRLAEIGSQAPQTQNPVTYREAKTLLHPRFNGDWKKINGEYQARPGPIRRPLSSACAQGTVFWVPIWRGLAF